MHNSHINSIFRFRNTKRNTDTSESNTGSDSESKKQIIIKKDLIKAKWRHIKPKRGYRNGIYPKWSRLRNKVYKSARGTFSNSFVSSIDRMRVSVSSEPIHPVVLTRSKSDSTLSTFVSMFVRLYTMSHQQKNDLILIQNLNITAAKQSRSLMSE